MKQKETTNRSVSLSDELENFKSGKTKFRVTTIDPSTKKRKVSFETYEQMKLRHINIEKSAQEFKELRKKLHMSQKELAEALRVNTRTLQGWESSRSPINPTAEILLRVLVRYPVVKSQMMNAYEQGR